MRKEINKINKSFYIHVKVTAGARKEFLKQKKEDHFEISVKEKAENNLANNRIIQIIGEYYKIPKNKIRIVNGHHHPSKLLVIEN